MTFGEIVKKDTETKALQNIFNPITKWIAVYQSPKGVFYRHEETDKKPFINSDDVEIYRIEEN